MTGNVINQWGKYRIFNKSCGPIDYIWKKIALNYFFMTYKFTFPSGLKTKKKLEKTWKMYLLKDLGSWE